MKTSLKNGKISNNPLPVNGVLVVWVWFFVYTHIHVHVCVYTHTHTHTLIHIYIYISSSSSCCAASTDIPDPLSPLLPIIHCLRQVFKTTSVSSHSCCMYVWAGNPAFAWPYVGVHWSTSLMSSSLLLQRKNLQQSITSQWCSSCMGLIFGLHTHTYACLYAHTRTHIHIYIYIYIYIKIYIYINIRIHIYIGIFMYIKYIYIYIYIYNI